MIEQITKLVCDGCGHTFAGGLFLTATQQRSLAAKDGWVYSNRKDLCSVCRPKRKDGQPWGSKTIVKHSKLKRYAQNNKRKR